MPRRVLSWHLHCSMLLYFSMDNFVSAFVSALYMAVRGAKRGPCTPRSSAKRTARPRMRPCRPSCLVGCLRGGTSRRRTAGVALPSAGCPASLPHPPGRTTTSSSYTRRIREFWRRPKTTLSHSTTTLALRLAATSW